MQDLQDIRGALLERIARVPTDQEACKRWLDIGIRPDRLVAWVDGPVRERWGVVAAARAYRIATTGRDGILADRFEKGLPHEKTMKDGRKVPGTIVPAVNAFAVSQILAWLAMDRHDVREQVGRMEEIPKLMKDLLELLRADSASSPLGKVN